MKKALLGILVFVVLCVIVGFWTLKDFDQKLRSEIIAVVSEKTGRSLVVEGETKTHFSFSPSVTINDIKLTNASWAEEPYMVQVDNLSVEAELKPLFSRQVKIKRFVLDGVRLNLEKNKEGKNNWSFLSEKKKSLPQGASEVKEKTETKKKTFSFIVNDLEMKNVSTVLVNRQKDETYNAALNTLNLQSNEGNMTLTSQWTVQGKTFSLSAKTDPLTVLFDGQKPYQFAAEISNQNLAVKIDGTMADPFKMNQIKASLKADVVDISALSAFVGYQLPAVKNMVLTAQIAGTADQLSIPVFDVSMGNNESFLAKAKGNILSVRPLVSNIQAVIDAPDMQKTFGLPALPSLKMSFQAQIDKGVELDQLKLKVGQSDLSGRVLIHADQNLAVYADVRSEVLDLSELLGVKSVYFKKIAPSEGKQFSDKKEKRRLFSDKPLPFSQLKAANINVTAAINKLIAADKTDLGKVTLAALMENGKFTVSNFKLADYISARAVLDASGKTAAVETNIKFNKMPLALFYAKKGIDRGTLTGSVHLNSNGISENALAAAMNGQIFLNVRDVHIDSFRLIELPSVLSFLSPADKNKPITVSCAVVNIPVKNGMLTSDKRIGVESSLFDLQVTGDINLGTEKLNLKVDVSPRSEGILESVFNSVSIGGTLAEPSARVNAEKTFDRALSLGMAFFMGGKEAAQELVRQEALKNVCAEAMAAAQ